MLQNLESNYDCSNAGSDLHELQQQLHALSASGPEQNEATRELINRLENQIHFIKNKCDIRP